MTDATTNKTTKTTKLKRSEADIRKETLSQGALLFKFAELAHPSDAKAYKKFRDQWRTLEQKGLFVTADGCLLPYSYYRKSNASGDRLKGHLRSAHFFFGREPDRTLRVNQHGWPCDEQCSHLCHRPDCVRPDHIVIEPRWANAKRNYCGEAGLCNCGSAPKCVRTYHNPETFQETLEFVTDKDRVLALLAALRDRHHFSIEPKSKYKVQDEQRENRNARKKRGREHKQQGEKKRQKQQQ